MPERQRANKSVLVCYTAERDVPLDTSLCLGKWTLWSRISCRTSIIPLLPRLLGSKSPSRQLVLPDLEGPSISIASRQVFPRETHV
jgi:hypothetical protein